MPNGFENSSYYIIPAKVSSLKPLYDKLASHGLWKLSEEKEPINYLMNYITSIYDDNRYCRCYNYTGDLFEIPDFPEVTVKNISLWTFGTGMVFISTLLSYGNMSLGDITNFANTFNKQHKAAVCSNGKTFKLWYNYIEQIAPFDDIKMFFNLSPNAGNFRKVCTTMHMIYQKKDEITEDTDKYLYYLKRNYNTSFDYHPETEEGIYDDYYAPHNYMKWALSQEGMVCLCTETDNKKTNSFIEGLMYSKHLLVEYYFMYLLLLNTRYTALNSITHIAEMSSDLKVVEEISERAVELRTKYCFRVVSDDMLFQNVYSKMYNIMEIENLLDDINENSDHLQMLEQNEDARTEKKMQYLLSGLSVLTIVSVLTDFSSYLEYFNIFNIPDKTGKYYALTSLYITIAFIVVFVIITITMFRKNHSRKK